MKKQTDTTREEIDKILYRKNTDYIDLLTKKVDKNSRYFQDDSEVNIATTQEKYDEK